MDCAMQSVFGLIGSHDPAIIPEASCSASVVRNRHSPAIGASAGKLKRIMHLTNVTELVDLQH
jgi:hypothetical protein